MCDVIITNNAYCWQCVVSLSILLHWGTVRYWSLKALGLLKAFEESADWVLLSSFCDDSNLHISVLSITSLHKGDGFGSIIDFFNRKSISRNHTHLQSYNLVQLQSSHHYWSYLKLVKFIQYSCQGRNEVRWRPGQEASLAPPCSNLRSFGSKFTVLKTVIVTLLGLFGAPQWFRDPIVTRRPGNCAPLVPPHYAPGSYYFFTKPA